jgi:hypothetical protein
VDQYARLRRLGPLTQVSYFASILGEPPAVRRKAYLLPDSEDYLRGLLDAYDESVDAETEAFSR